MYIFLKLNKKKFIFSILKKKIKYKEIFYELDLKKKIIKIEKSYFFF